MGCEAHHAGHWPQRAKRERFPRERLPCVRREGQCKQSWNLEFDKRSHFWLGLAESSFGEHTLRRACACCTFFPQLNRCFTTRPPTRPPALTLASQSTVCCTLLKCNAPRCSGLTLRVFYVPPASGGTGCQQLAQPLPAMGPISPLVRARSFGCTASSGTHDATVLNPFAAAVSIYATDGADCGRSPATSSLFKSYGPTWDRAGTRATTLSFTGAPCQATPCCTLVDWSRPSPKLRTPPEKRRRKAPP